MKRSGVEAGFPVLAVVDPKLMLTVPPKFTAYQGFDALFHSVESYISKFANLASDMYALTAIEHIARNLPRAVANGDRSRSSDPRGLRQHPFRRGDVPERHDQPALDGTRHVGLPPGSAPRRRG